VRRRQDHHDESEGRGGVLKSDGPVSIDGTVLEALPHGLFRVGIERQRQVTAHVPSGPGRNFIRVLVGDRVRLELSPRDLNRGRIVEKLG
jgi:translation initiation factor IF-1